MTSSGPKRFAIEYDVRVLDKDVPLLPKSALTLIKRAIEKRLTTHPLEYGKPLRDDLSGMRRIRVSDYRIIYSIDLQHHLVTIRAIGHRKHVYH